MELMFEPLKKYAQFHGRARRKEYWLFYLFYIVVYAVLMSVAGATGNGQGPGGVGLALVAIFALAMLVPSLAVSFRRLHDTNRSAWWLLIALLPFIGAVVLLIFFVLEGTAGPNRFGPDPKGRDAAEVFA